MSWSGSMSPGPSHKGEKRGREVQRGLFGGPDLDGGRLPQRQEVPGRERADELRMRPPARRAAPGQSLLPFGRPTPPTRAPTTEARPQAEASARSEPPRLPALPPEAVATGEVAKARELIQAIRVLKRIEAASRSPDVEERRALERFGGFGAL